MAAGLAIFAGCWWGWEALRLPPAGPGRLGVALAVGAAVSAAAGGPLFFWAARQRSGEQGGDHRDPTQIVGAVGGSVFGPGSDFRGARLEFGTGAAAAAPVGKGQVVVGEIPREPPAFVECETLRRLAEAASQRRVAVVCAVTGLRGVGKTQLAAAYARARIGEGCGLVGWVNADTRDSLLTDLARVAEAAGVADPEGDSAESARRLRDYLGSRPGDGLLVFDNASDPDGLRPFLPAAGGTVVVITSVDRAFAGFGRAVDVAAFTRAEAVDYLAARTGLADQEGAAAVAGELGDLPLGLAQAAATITGQQLTYQRYLERLRGVPVAAVLGHVPGDDYPHATAAALLLNVRSAEVGDPSGLTSRLLRVVAALSPDGVRRDLLDGLAPGHDGQGDVDAAAERCAARSLLTWSRAGNVVIMHRLLGRVLHERDQAVGWWSETVTAALSLLEPSLFGEDQAWSRREHGSDLAIQIEALWEAGTSDHPGDPAPPVTPALS